MSNPENENPKQEKSWVNPVIKIMGFLLVLSGLPFFYVIVPTLKEIRRGMDWTESIILAILIIVLIGMPMAIAAGIGLMRRAEWSHGLARLVALIPTLAGIANMLTDPTWPLAISTAVISIPGAILFIVLSLRDVRVAFGTDAEESFAASLKTVFRYVVMLTLGMVVIGLTLSQLPDIVQDLKVSRWQSQCEESGEIQACGNYGHALIRKQGDSNEDWAKGLSIIKDLCDRGNSYSCRRYAYFLSYTDTDHLKRSAAMIVKNVDAVAEKECFEGNGRGCFVLKLRFGSAGTILSNRDEVMAKSLELCRTGDVWACRAIFQMSVVESDSIKPVDVADERMAIEKLCDDGFAIGCGALYAGKEDQAKIEEVCREKPGMSACAKLASELAYDGSELRRAFCREGGLEACSGAAGAVPMEEPNRKLIVALYQNMGDVPSAQKLSLHPEFGFWSVEPIDVEPSELETACDEGTAEACFALGLHISRDRRGELEPELGKLADYDRSFMQACRLGMNAGCLAYAERIMNRPITERRRVEEANEALEIACERGSEIACWHIDIGDELVDEIPEGYEDLLMRGCRAQEATEARRGACRELAYFWAHEFGGTPWLFSERRSRVLVRKHCEESHGKWSCAHLIWTRPWGSGSAITSTNPPWHVEYFTAGKKSCKRRNLWACGRMLAAARSYPAIEESTIDELKSGVCEALPEVDECGKH